MMMTRRLSIPIALIMAVLAASAQHFSGMSGLINAPSADMNPEGNIMLGGYYLNKHFTPASNGLSNFSYDGKNYDTFDFYLSVTPFRWVEVAYVFTLEKSIADGHDHLAFNAKDRYFAVKFQPLREGRWYPSIAIGATDFLMSSTGPPGYEGRHDKFFTTYYIAATKHFPLWAQDFSVNIAYRHSGSSYTRKWQGVVGGITWNPRWIPDLRAIVEYTGNEINIGADITLWKHLFLQVCLQDGKYFSAGACFRANLF